MVSLAKCADYDSAHVDKAMQSLFHPLGGLENYVSRGDKVHLKINLLSAKDPKRAITTHPAVIESVVRMAQDIGAKVQIGDSPAGAVKGLQRYWDNCGITDIAKRTGAKIVALETGGVVKHQIGDHVYHVSKHVVESDVIINLPKIKTHGLTLYTGAIKNLFGTIPGLRKSEYHKQAPHPEDFAEILVDIFSIIRPQLTIADAIVGMEGNGPSTSGHPRQIGILLASEDGVALDAVAAHIMGFKENEIDTTVSATKRGLGIGEIDKIKIEGEDLETLRIKDFQLPSNRLIKFIPRRLMFMLAKLVWVRPRPIADVCKRCGACVKNCPVQAISEDETGLPVIDYDLCIKCMCCDEVCQHNAMEQEMSWIAKKLS